jgi:hypothetical protein
MLVEKIGCFNVLLRGELEFIVIDSKDLDRILPIE